MNRELNNYRIIKKWCLDSKGDKQCRYYPQFKGFYGWCFLKERYNGVLKKPEWSGFVTVIFMLLFLGMLVSSITGLIMGIYYFLYSIPAVIFYAVIANMFSNKIVPGKAVYDSEDDAKKFLLELAKREEEERELEIKKLKNKKELPDDEVLFLSITAERKEKLKKLKI